MFYGLVRLCFMGMVEFKLVSYGDTLMAIEGNTRDIWDARSGRRNLRTYVRPNIALAATLWRHYKCNILHPNIWGSLIQQPPGSVNVLDVF